MQSPYDIFPHSLLSPSKFLLNIEDHAKVTGVSADR